MRYEVEKADERGQMKDFLDLPYRVYKDDPDWVAPLRSEVARVLDDSRNPYFRNASLARFVCYAGGNPMARAVAVINRDHWTRTGNRTAFFGFFEALDDEGACRALFGHIGTHCAARGATALEGPFNPNHYSEMGILRVPDGPPVFFEPYNPAYYGPLLEACGLKPSKTLHTCINRDARAYLAATATRDLGRHAARGFTVRTFRLQRTGSELEHIREVFNDAFSDNWNFLPLSREEYRFSARYLFSVTSPGLVLIAEHRGKPVGVLECMLNINPALRPMKGRATAAGMLLFLARRRKIREVVIYAAGIRKDYRGSPVILLLLERMRAITERYPVLYTTWMSDDQPASLRAAKLLGLEPFRYFDIYSTKLDHAR